MVTTHSHRNGVPSLIYANGAVRVASFFTAIYLIYLTPASLARWEEYDGVPVEPKNGSTKKYDVLMKVSSPSHHRPLGSLAASLPALLPAHPLFPEDRPPIYFAICTRTGNLHLGERAARRAIGRNKIWPIFPLRGKASHESVAAYRPLRPPKGPSRVLARRGRGGVAKSESFEVS